MMIAIEGMDGVGKTAIAKHIASKFGFLYLDKPLKNFYSNEQEFIKISAKMYDVKDNIIKSWYFCLGDLFIARKYQNKNVIFDRYLASNYYWNADKSCEPIFETLINYTTIPSLTIVLFATTKTRLERLKLRNPHDPDLSDADILKNGYDKLFYFLEKYKMPYVVIDTENKTLDEVKTLVEREIKNLSEVDYGNTKSS